MAHPAVGGKGLPPVVSAPVYIPSSPAASSVVSGYAPPSHLASSYHATTAGPPPDLTTRIQLKLRYLRLQSKYNRSIEVSLTPPLLPHLSLSSAVSLGSVMTAYRYRHGRISKSNSQRRKRPSSGYRMKSSTFASCSPPLFRCSRTRLIPSPLPQLDHRPDLRLGLCTPIAETRLALLGRRRGRRRRRQRGRGARPGQGGRGRRGSFGGERQERKAKDGGTRSGRVGSRAEDATRSAVRHRRDETKRAFFLPLLPSSILGHRSSEWLLRSSSYRSRSRAFRPLHRRQRPRHRNKHLQQRHPSYHLHNLLRRPLRHIRPSPRQVDQYRRRRRRRPLRLRRRNGSSSSLAEEAARER